MTPAALTLGAAFAAGLAGSAHCAAMCGGIAGAAGASFARSARRPLAAAFAFNAARLASYALVGAALARAVGGLGHLATAALPAIALGARVVAALVLAALGLRLLTGRDLLGAERLGAAFWTVLRPLAARASATPATLRPVALGSLWGFMPCGLVYSVLLVAATSGAALDGAATLLAFGAGTLPAMMGLTLGGAAMARGLRRPALRRAAGALVVAAAAWTLVAALVHPPGVAHLHAHHDGAPEPFASRYPNP